MATLRATQFASGVFSGTAVTNIYTVPAGHKAILKSITLLEVSGVSCIVNVRLSAFGTWYAQILSAYGSAGMGIENRMWVVLEAGQVLQFNRSNAGQITYTVNGSLMTI
jgi:hypothetical protein